jgi:dipeptidyl aminopeptidase/acylaminoacyl peptidase
MPHGGPWGRDSWGWDKSHWITMLASRGYAVINPQFRGSEGWGRKLWVAGDAQWGKSMQDDNDDAAHWMVAQGFADPKRIAIFGYSYGGYAAIVGAIRPNGLYRCAIPGAGVMELPLFQNRTDISRFLREYQRPSIEGLNPMEHAAEVSIPVLLIHGDRDQTVNIEESRKMNAALLSRNKSSRLVTLKDWGHQLNKWSPAEEVKMLDAMETFLSGECGMGAK